MKKIEVEKKFWHQVNDILDLILEVENEMEMVPAGDLDKDGADLMSEGIYKLYKRLEGKVVAIKCLDLHNETWQASEFHNIFYNGLEQILVARADMQKKMWSQIRLHKAYQAL